MFCMAAQSLGYNCDVGFFARPERVALTVVGLAIGDPTVLAILVITLAVVANLTVLQRINEVWRQARAERRAATAAAKLPTSRSGERTVP